MLSRQLLPKAKSLAIHHLSSWKASTAQSVRDGFVIESSLQKPTIPALGFGTWGVGEFSNELMAKSVDTALKMGYRHLDCARVYGNEREIGYVIADNIKNGVVRREELFVASKYFNDEWESIGGALESTLKDLQLEYVDSFLTHWPLQNTPNMSTEPLPYDLHRLFAAHSKLFEQEVAGLTKSIGICNCSTKKMSDLIALCDAAQISRPAILQNEIHPYFQQTKLLEFCRENKVVLTGFMPLGSPERPARSRRDDDPVVLKDPVFQEIAEECGHSAAQVIIRWHLQRGTVCIPKATEEWMIRQNLETLDFALDADQMARIDALDKGFRFHRGEFLGWKEMGNWRELWDYE